MIFNEHKTVGELTNQRGSILIFFGIDVIFIYILFICKDTPLFTLVYSFHVTKNRDDCGTFIVRFVNQYIYH
jgi:hypothetical protein